MQTFSALEIPRLSSKPVALTIGNFDGVHLGHQAVLSRLKQIAKSEGGTCAAITFENHPSKILRPKHAVESLCTLSHKVRLIEELGIDHLFLIPFTRDLARLSADAFLKQIRQFFDFYHLVLGSDAAFGRDKHGDIETINKISKDENFFVEYLPAVKAGAMIVSSTHIRSALVHGDFATVCRLLGRPYSIYSKVIPGTRNGRAIGFPTANLRVDGLCLPPFGVYTVWLLHKGNRYPGVANLGRAPTLKQEKTPTLEVHIFNYQDALYDEDVEVEFVAHLRAEQKFPSVEALQLQIRKDIQEAKKLLE